MNKLHPLGVPIVKMHGLGNDFVVLDFRVCAVPLDTDRIRAIADRHTGVGCDQLVMMEPPRTERAFDRADVFMAIFNADGGEVFACGNATRCVGSLLMDESGRDRIVIETHAGFLDVQRGDAGLVTVDMGQARIDWRGVPLSREEDTLHLPLVLGPLADGVGVSMGNPHAVFFVPDVQAVDLATLGPMLEHDPLFPERANIEVVQVLDHNRLRMRVWERGVGITRACGTGACAALVAAVRRGLATRRAEVILDGGVLTIEWLEDGRVKMMGPVAISFTGVLHETLL